MKLNLATFIHLLPGAALVAIATSASGADKTSPAPAASQNLKPAWLTDLSVSVKEGYDDNLLAVSGDGPMQPASSWFTTVSPKFGLNLAPLLGKGPIQLLSFGYAPDFVAYHDDPVDVAGEKESYNIHRLTTVIKGKQDAFSFNLDNAFSYVDGSKDAPTYLGLDNARSAFATGVPRERRNQFQDKAKIVFQYDWKKIFVRPVANLNYYELLTNLKTNIGYQNYADRYDVNGGADLGYKLNSKITLTLGYRYGHQYQEAYPAVNDRFRNSSTSDYHRALLGVEAKPWKWLTVSLQGGPDFRHYGADAPVNDKNPIKYYGEASISADISANDSLTFKYRQYQWVASTGRAPYFDSNYDLIYRRKISKALALDLGLRLLSSDYTSGNLATSLRDDRQYSIAAVLNYSVNANLALNLGYNYDLGRNAQENLPAPQYREFDRQIFAVGAVLKF